MADFITALPKILKHEGVVYNEAGAILRTGYVNHPDDPGGETNYGITKAVAVQNGYTGELRAIPFSKVKEIYRRKYWNKIGGDNIPDQEIAVELFDTAVNMGVSRVSVFLQRVLNALNVKATKYPDIDVDGQIGRTTLNTLHAALQVRPWYRLAILRALDSLQCVRYIELSEHNEKFETFMPGWLRTRVGRHG